MSEKIKNDYYSVFAHAFVGKRNPFQDKTFSQLYDQQTSITLSNSGDLAKDSEKQETSAYFCDHF